MVAEPKVVGGVRARGARQRRIAAERVEEVDPSDVKIGDELLHRSYRTPVVVRSIDVDKNTDVTTLYCDQVVWKIGKDTKVQRLLPDSEEAL